MLCLPNLTPTPSPHPHHNLHALTRCPSPAATLAPTPTLAASPIGQILLAAAKAKQDDMVKNVKDQQNGDTPGP